MVQKALIYSPARVATLLLVDVALVSVFAMIGVASHDGELSLVTVGRAALPFLLAYLIPALLFSPHKNINNTVLVGIPLWISTILGGALLRYIIFQDTSAGGFLLVTTAVLGVFLLGRRLVSSYICKKRHQLRFTN